MLFSVCSQITVQSVYVSTLKKVICFQIWMLLQHRIVLTLAVALKYSLRWDINFDNNSHKLLGVFVD